MNGTLLLLLVLFGAAQLGALFWLYHKLSGALDRLDKRSAPQADNVIAQVEALLALYAELRPGHGLPPMRGWAASPDFLRVLTQLVGERRPSVVVECSSGVSTLVVASCLKRLGGGRVFSLEHDPVYAEKTRALLRLHGLDAVAEVVDAPLVDLELPGWSGKWYDHSRLPESAAIDLLVVDGPPWFSAERARYPALPALRRRLAPDARIVLDDADRAAEKAIVAQWLDETPGMSRLDVAQCEKGCVLLGLGTAGAS